MNSATSMLAAGSGSGINPIPILLLAGFCLVFYFAIIRPQSKRRRSMVEMQSSLTPGAEVVTIGGLYGTVVDADDESVSLEIAPGVNARYARGAIAKVITSSVETTEETDTAEPSTEPETGAVEDAQADEAEKAPVATTEKS